MSNSAITGLKTTLGMGARANKYRVDISGSGGVRGAFVDVLCKSTAIPARAFNDIAVWNQGRLVNIAGDVDFSGTWSCTFIDDENHSLRGAVLAWMEQIDSSKTHSRRVSAHNDYMKTAILQQLSTIDNTPTATYVFEDVWPKSISDSSLDDSNGDLIEFTVEFEYSSWAKE